MDHSQPLLIINECFMIPQIRDCDGDSNGDGQYVHDNDEFIEFVNLGGTLDISDFQSVIILRKDMFFLKTVISSGGILVYWWRRSAGILAMQLFKLHLMGN